MKALKNFEGQSLYIGIDVHKNSWSVSILGEHSSFKGFTQPPSAQVLHQYLTKNFPFAYYKAAYEAGFCGFRHCKELIDLGVDCIVVNPADIPTKDKEVKRKSDIVDSAKIARSLRSQELEGIFIPDDEILELRGILRFRNRLVRDQTRCKNRIKSFLYFNGVKIPDQYNNSSWSHSYLAWLKELATNKTELSLLINDFLRKAEMVKLVTQSIKQKVKTSRFNKHLMLLKSIPGIGALTSINLILEIGDINRFKRVDQLNAFVGLIPNMSASGEKEYTGEITARGNNHLKNYLIEASWIAITKDPELMADFNRLCGRMTKNRVIIRIAKKLCARIKAVLTTEQPYKINYNL